MNAEITNIAENRALTETESAFIRWLLEHGNERARSFLPQIEDAWVISRCGCGCASIDLNINSVTHKGKADIKNFVITVGTLQVALILVFLRSLVTTF